MFDNITDKICVLLTKSRAFTEYPKPQKLLYIWAESVGPHFTLLFIWKSGRFAYVMCPTKHCIIKAKFYFPRNTGHSAIERTHEHLANDYMRAPERSHLPRVHNRQAFLLPASQLQVLLLQRTLPWSAVSAAAHRYPQHTRKNIFTQRISEKRQKSHQSWHIRPSM